MKHEEFPEFIREIKDTTERAIYEAAYLEGLKPDTGTISRGTVMYMIYGGMILFVVFVFYIAIRAYRRNNPRSEARPARHKG